VVISARGKFFPLDFMCSTGGKRTRVGGGGAGGVTEDT
jgi:hypothetical protein